MAKPRVFLSSTYYDLKQVRADLERFIREQGYEPVLNEQGNIPYGKERPLEDYCYKEVGGIDILVSIIGGRFGSSSHYGDKSVSQMELSTAFEQNKQVYIFIEKNVYQEYKFYLNNKDKEGIKYEFADSIKIYEFIEFVEGLSNNNTIHSFETSRDITNFLKEQWAGLFQSFLLGQSRIKEVNLIKGLETTSDTLNQLVKFLTEERTEKDNAINEILMSNHPALEQIQQLLGVNYRVYFTNYKELDELLKAKGFESRTHTSFTEEENSAEDLDNYHWELVRRNNYYSLTVSREIFTEDYKLKIYRKEDWNKKFISLDIEDLNEPDDLPF